MQVGWYIDKGYHHGKLSFIYQGWFPVINLSVDYGDKAFNVDWTQNDKGQDITQSIIPNEIWWKQKHVSISLLT